ncbi:MAG: beta-ketoacyl-[acyl-carrier-protein] synthase family protein [Candidatus Omnitrophota bacterium]
MTDSRKTVITGVGVISPNGIGKTQFWEAIKTGKSGISKITGFDPSQFPTKVAGEVKDFVPEDFFDHKKVRRMDRFVQFAMAVAKMAIEDSSLKLNREDHLRIGVVAGTATGGQGWVFEQYKIFCSKGYKRLNPFTAVSTFPNAASSQISVEYKLKGPSITISTGCASGGMALGYGAEMIRSGKVDIVIAVGSEALLYAPIFGTYCKTGVMSVRDEEPVRTPKPFDRGRDGIVLGEGAGAVILESAGHALDRKARIYAELAGWGETCDGYHMITPDPKGLQAERAIEMALEQSGAGRSGIDYVKTHGVGGVLNDKIETDISKRIFGKRAYAIPSSSIKSMIGHMQGAAGIVETIAGLLAMENDTAPPTINYEDPDPECDLDYVPNKARNMKIGNMLSLSFGFGGKNTALVLRKI